MQDNKQEISSLIAIYGEENVDVQESVIFVQPCVDSRIKMAAFISSNYPNEPPIVTVEGISDIESTKLQELDATLLEISAKSKGEPMLFDLAQEVDQWVSQQREMQIKNCQNENSEDEKQQDAIVLQVPETTESEMMSFVSNTSHIKGKEGQKKPRMKTAYEVIKRIQWDERLDALNFMVGYEDRFLGIQEKPFNDFTWKDLATVGIYDLAIPQHRIQYFKYQGVVVWDKGTQMDNVFGSRGGSAIYELLDELEERDRVESGDDDDDDDDDDEEDENEDQIDEDEDKSLKAVKDGSSFTDDMVMANTKSSSKRPNFFVCFKVDNQAVVQKVDQVQQYILSQAQDLQELCIPLKALHVTLCMLKLKSQDQLDKARAILRQSQDALASLLASNNDKMQFKGVSSFRDRVVYAKITNPQNGLERAVDYLRERFKEGGIPVPDDYREYNGHLTILKMSPLMSRKLNMSFVDRGLYFPFQHDLFGGQEVNELHLCSVNSPFQYDGFYTTLQEIPLISSQAHSVEVSEFLKEIYDSWKEREDVDLPDSYFEKVSQLILQKPVDLIQLGELTRKQALKGLDGFLLLIRGLPGIGRSYLANYLAGKYENQVAILDFSDDILSTDSLDGLQLQQFMDKIRNNYWFIIVEGVFQYKWQYQVLLQLASAINYGTQVVELTCDVGTTGVKLAIARSKLQQRIHKKFVLQDAEKMLGNWEMDESSRIVSAYIEKVAEVHDPCSQVAQVCESFVLQVKETRRQKRTQSDQLIRYTAVFLTQKSRKRLLEVFYPEHDIILADHMTIQYQPNIEEVEGLPLGEEVTMVVKGVATDGQIQAVQIGDISNKVLQTLVAGDHIYHVTISHKEGVPPALANTLLNYQNGSNIAPVSQMQRVCLEGVIGCLVDSNHDSGELCRTKVFDLQTLSNHCSKGSKLEKQYNGQSLCLGPKPEITNLYVFDFDGTLFDHPDNPSVNQSRLIENITEVDTFCLSLDTPLIPCRAIPLYRRYCKSAGSMTIILTGRWNCYLQDIQALLKREKLHSPDKFIFKPQEFEQPTSEFKVTELRKLLEQLPSIQKIWIIDDLAGILAAYSRFAQTDFGQKFEFEILDVVGQPQIQYLPLFQNVPSLHRDCLFKYLGQYGYFPDATFVQAAHAGIDYILDVWSGNLGYEEDKYNLLMIQGGFSIGRRGDVDIALLSPYGVRQSDCAQRLYDELENNGVNYLYSSPASALPRIRCKLQFFGCQDIEFDIVFSRVNREIYKNGFNDTKELAAAVQLDDEASQRTLEGKQLQDKIQKSVSKLDSNHGQTCFAIVVEALVHLFDTYCLHGNVFHCPRTVHLILLVVSAINNKKSSSTKKVKLDTPFQLFQEVIRHAKQWTQTQWKKHFGKFVPENYIPSILNMFEQTHASLEQFEKFGKTNLEDRNWGISDEFKLMFNLLSVSKIDLKSQTQELYTKVGVQVKEQTSTDEDFCGLKEFETWKLGVFVEARAQSYVRKILDAGIDLRPWKFHVDEREKQIDFEVLVDQKKAERAVVKTMMQGLVEEIQLFNCRVVVFFN